jgi:hypothetical protein
MMRLAVAALVLTGLASPVALATTPTWTAKGAITTLRLQSITVHGQTCQITTASPGRATLRLYSLGTEAKIACTNGVLRAIYPLHTLKPIVSGPPVFPAPPPASPTSPGLDNAILLGQSLISGGMVVSRSESLVAVPSGSGFPITALTDTSITAGSGRSSVTCAIASGSPDLGFFQVGDRLSRMDCRNGGLTSITRAA